MNGQVSKDGMSEAEKKIERLLEECREVPERAPSAKAESWHRVRRAILVPHGVPMTRQLPWAVALGAVCAASLVIGGFAGLLRNGRGHAGEATAIPTTHEETSAAIETAQPATEDPAHAGWRAVDLGTVGQLSLSPTAALRLPASEPAADGAYVVGLDSGELCAAITHRDVPRQGPFVVEATALRVVVVGTKFCVSAGPSTESSWVSVEEGRVRVEREGHSATVGAGESLQGNDPQLWAAAASSGADLHPVHAAASTKRVTSCPTTDPLPQRRRCLWLLSGGDDLAAQNALYLLGQMARDQERDGPAALSIWQTYRHRFARGAMSAEVDLAMFDELLAERRFNEALTVSGDFLDQFGSYFRAGEVALKRADILRVNARRPGDAAQGYRRILEREANADRRGEALFGLALSQESLGEHADAQSTWNRYQKEFPQGRHSAEAAQHLAGRSPADR